METTTATKQKNGKGPIRKIRGGQNSGEQLAQRQLKRPITTPSHSSEASAIWKAESGAT